MSSTITIPAGARVVGEAWSVIAGSGHAFLNQDEPQVVVRVGEKGSQGVVEITDMLFTTVGPGTLFAKLSGFLVPTSNLKPLGQS